MSQANTLNVVEMRKRITLNKSRDYIFWIIGLLSTLIGFVLLFTLIIDLFIDGFPRLSWQFLVSYPSRFPEKAGILSAWVGTTLVMIVTAATAVPLGIGAGIYLEEYGKKNWLTHLIEINMNNLAGVPFHHLRSFGIGTLCLFFEIWRKHPDRRSHPRSPDPSYGGDCHQGVYSCYTQFHPGSFLRFRSNKMADDQRPHPPLFFWRNSDRDDHRAFKGHRRDRAYHHSGGSDFYCFSPFLSHQPQNFPSSPSNGFSILLQ